MANFWSRLFGKKEVAKPTPPRVCCPVLFPREYSARKMQHFNTAPVRRMSAPLQTGYADDNLAVAIYLSVNAPAHYVREEAFSGGGGESAGGGSSHDYSAPSDSSSSNTD